MQSIATPAMTRADTPLELPTEKLLVQQQQQLVLQQQQQLQSPATEMATPATRRRRMAAKKFKGPATLKIEIVRAVVTTTDVATETVSDAVRSSTNNDTIVMEVAVHGTSAALDGMEDKDELVRTLQRCRCDHLHLSPPAVLFSWDVTHDECVNVIGKNGIPTLTVSGSTGGIATNTEPAATTSDTQQQPPAAGDVEPSNADTKTYAVLKEPMGSQGRGIYFVASAEEIHKIIDEHHKRAKNEPDFLDNLIAVKGRIPSWGTLVVALLYAVCCTSVVEVSVMCDIRGNTIARWLTHTVCLIHLIIVFQLD